MSGERRPKPLEPSELPLIDRGTQTSGTAQWLARGLTVVLSPFLHLGQFGRRVARGSGSVLLAVYRLLTAIARRGTRAVERLSRFVVEIARRVTATVARVAGPLIEVARRLADPIAGALRTAGRALLAFTRQIARLLLVPIRLLARRANLVLDSLVRLLPTVGGVLNAAFRRIVRPLGVAVRIVTRAISARFGSIARAVARLGRVLTDVWRRAHGAVLTFARFLAGVIAAVLRPVVLAVSTAGHILAAGARWLAGALSRIARLVRAALVAIFRPLALVVSTAGHILAAGARWLAGALSRIARLVGAALVAILRPLARTVRRWVLAAGPPIAAATDRLVAVVAPRLESAARRLARLVSRTAGAVARAIDETEFAVRVALVKARVRLETPAPEEFAQARRAARRRCSTAIAPEFTVVVHQNQHLPADARDVTAVLSVSADGAAPAELNPSAENAVVILLDCSGSMGRPWSKLRAACRATEAAIDAMRDGTWFAVVRANHDAEVVYPRSGGLAPATDETRAAAKAGLGLLWPEGGTAMSSWLLLARNLLATRPRAIPHVILLTDGRNESESRAALDAALGRCAGRFQCDCRGVGTDWEVAELRSIASTLLGTVDIVPLPQDLEADFRAMTESVMGKAVRDVTLQIWTPRGARLRSLLQTAPTVEDLTGMRVDIDERTGAYRTGAWGTESRDYHLDLEVPGHEVGTEMLVARVRVCLGPEVLAQALVRAVWTEDEDVVTSVDPVVAHSGRDAEFAEAVRTAFDARRAGDDAAATAEFGRAALLAAANGDEMKLELLSGVVDLVDATSGTVQLRTQVDAVDEMLLETRSTRTRRVRVAAQ